MSKVEKEGYLNADVENRSVVGLRKMKKVDALQASKRPALRNLPKLGLGLGQSMANIPIARIQPFRTAKRGQSLYQNDNSVQLVGSNLVPLTVPSFSFYCDAKETKDKEEKCATSVQSRTTRLQVHTGVTGLQRQPLSLLPEANSHDKDDSLDSSGSPMILDESSVEDRLSNIYYSQELLLIPEYAQDIYLYLRESEMQHRPKSHYLKKQPDITANMRAILVDWLVEVGEEYRLQQETLYLAIAYIDRFLSCMSVLRGRLQLVGTTCMFIAAKYEEIYPPEVGEFVSITDDTYTKKQVLRMEHLILKMLSFDLATPTSYYFLERFCKIEHASKVTKYLAMYLVELTLLEAEPYLRYLPSIIAGSALCIGNILTGREMWCEELCQLTGYSVTDFRECLFHLHHTLKNADNNPQQAIKEKYRKRKYLTVADIVPEPSLIDKNLNPSQNTSR